MIPKIWRSKVKRRFKSHSRSCHLIANNLVSVLKRMIIFFYSPGYFYCMTFTRDTWAVSVYSE